MTSYISDVIRIAHAATRLAALPGTDHIIADIPRLADLLEHAVVLQEAYFFGQSVHLPQGLTPPGTQHATPLGINGMPSMPTICPDVDAWLDGQSLPDADATSVRTQAAK